MLDGEVEILVPGRNSDEYQTISTKLKTCVELLEKVYIELTMYDQERYEMVRKKSD